MAPTERSRTNGLIRVTDVRATMRQHSDTLGIDPTCMSEQSGTPTLSVVCRDGVELHVRVCACKGGRHAENAVLEVAERSDTLNDEFTSAGAELVSPLTRQDWGRSLTITDPGGSWLMFSQCSRRACEPRRGRTAR